MLINALVAANKPFTMMEYPNRTHCICQGRNTQQHLFELITRYLDQNLKAGPAAAPLSERAATGSH
jgi:dipeptidyl-peptidase-4